MKYCGIDPGLSGGIAFTDGTYEKMPTILDPIDRQKVVSSYGVHKALTKAQPDVILVEHQQPQGGNTSRVACFKMGRNYQALLEGVKSYAEIADRAVVVVVRPQQWKRTLGLIKGTSKDKKAGTFILVKNIYGLVLKNSQDGIADALAIAEYGRRKY